MKLTKRLIALLLAVLMLPVWNPTVAAAIELPQPSKAESGTIPARVNPLYAGLYTVDDFDRPELPEPSLGGIGTNATYVSMTQGTAQMRTNMKNRAATFTIYVLTEDSDATNVANTLFAEVLVHTGKPTEGDYLQWQWATLEASYERTWNGSAYEYALTFGFTYYTTAAQENQVTTAVNNLINTLGIRNKSDYEKIKGVYDWICANVTYDYDTLNDDTYTLKFSAYAALINRTAVCQGYALLFYRMMLELGIDSRFIAGIGGGGAHGWNIVELDGLYYNADTTWDAGMSRYGFFLTSTWDFEDHYRYLDYETWEFHEAYPMAAESYQAGVTAEKDPYIYIDYCGDNAGFAVMRDGLLVIAGEGATYDYNYQDITEGGAPWRFWGEHINTLVVDEGITGLGDYAFYYTMPNLKSVTLPDTLTSIGEYAFYFCTGLTKIILPEALTTIGSHAFTGCDGLKTITIPENVTDIDFYAFMGCSNLTSAKVYAKKVSGSCFSGCEKLADVYLSDNVAVLEQYAFANCPALTEFVIPGSVTVIQPNVFEGCTGLKNLYFTGDLPDLNYYSFQGLETTAWYPVDNDTWTEESLSNYSGTITWKSKQYAIITNVIDKAVALEGETASVTVEALGDELTYAWYIKNAGESKFSRSTSVTGPAYAVEMNEARNGRQLYCVVTDKYGVTAKSDVITLAMVTAATIVEEPQDAQAQLGEIATTTVRAGGKGLTYVWYAKDPGGEFVKTDETTLSYSLEMTVENAGHQAYCVVTDEDGNSVTSRTVTFGLAATITAQPQDAEAMENETATVSFEAVGDGLTYQWYFKNADSESFYPTSTFTGNSYSAVMNEERDERQIYCVITDQYGNSVQTDTVTLYAIIPVCLNSEPLDAQTRLGVYAGTSVYATGKDLTYTWYAKDPGGEFAKTDRTGSYYSVKMTEENSGHQAYCVVTDRFGYSVTTRIVTFGLSVTLIEQPPAEVYGYRNEEAVVTIKAVGDGLTYEWYYAAPGSDEFVVDDSATSDSYRVILTDATDGSQVRCIVRDQYGNSQRTFMSTLKMMEKLEITRQPESVKVKNGKVVTIDFEATGEGLTYAWYYKNAGDSEFSLTTSFTSNSYTTQMNDARNGRQVYCVVTDKYGNSVQTDTVTMTLAEPPVITRQPASVAVLEGETVTVDFEVQGDGLTYKWYYKNAGSSKFILTTTFTGNSYTMQMTAARAGRQIYCVITDQYGNSVQTDTVTLGRMNPLEITRQPVSVTVANGKVLKIDFEVQGDGLTYAWYYKNAGDSEFSLTTSFTSNSYTTQMNAARAGRQVYCVVTDKYGNSVQTDTVTMTLAEPPVITRQPVSVTGDENETVVIDFAVEGVGLTYKWYYKNAGDTKFTLTKTFTGNSYTTQMNTARSGRQVYCVITDKYGNTVKTDTVTMTLVRKLEILRQPVSVSGAEGETVKIDFEVKGDGLTYKWYYKNAGDTKFILTKTFTGNSYTTQMNAARNGRQVYCVVTDKYGSSVQTDTVTMILEEPPVITRQPVSVTGDENETVVIDFEVEGVGLTYAWYIKNAGDSKFTLTKTFTGNSYTAQMNAARSGRQVYCVITDKYGNTVKTDTVTMTLVRKLEILRQPVSVTGTEGETVKIDFQVKGDGLTYKWYYKNAGDSKFVLTKTFTGNSYTTQMTAARSGRQVYCVITDKYGNSVQTDTVTMTMKAPTALAITRQPVSVTVAEGEMLTIDFEAVGDGLTYRWYYKDAGTSKFYYTATFSGNSYTTEMTTARDGRQVYCVVTDKYGNSVQTDTVSMTMKSEEVTDGLSASGICGENAAWVLTEDGTLTISGTGAIYDYEFEAAPWFTYQERITAVVVGEGITRLGENAFRGMVNLVSADLSDTITEIGNFAFYDDEKLSQVELPANLESLGQEAFTRCALTAVEIPGSVTFIDACVFMDCASLTDVVIHSGDVPSMTFGNSPFRGCSALENIYVDDGHFALFDIDGILYGYFNEGYELLQYPIGRKDTTLNIADGTLIINMLALETADNLEEVIIPASVKEIYNFAFSCSANLKTIRFQGDAPAMEEYTFNGVTAVAYYPADNETWTADVMQNYGGNITWMS